MHWTPLSGAKFEDVFGPSGAPARKRSRNRRGRPTCRLAVESLESRLTPAITANIVASSLASVTPPNVTIGEIVRVKVVVQQDLSGNYDPTAFNVDAALPAGLQYLPGTADMALVSANGITSTLDPSNTLGLDVTGSSVNVNSVNPMFGIPSTAISTDPTTGAMVFNTGISHANDNGTTPDYIVIEYNAIVLNVAGNQAAPPTNLTTNFQLIIGNKPCATASTTVNVVEPSITNLNKTAQVSADGNTATYTLTFSNTGNSTAYDVQVLDSPAAGLTLNLASVQVVGGTGLTNRSTATNLNLSFDSIAPGASVTITYSAAIAAADKTGQPLTNTVGLQYTSLPGPNGTSPNPTGTVTPGTPGTPDGERTGTGGVNDYSDTAWAAITVQPPAQQPDSLAGFVFADLNHSGDYDAGDLLLPGAVITLEDANGNPVTDLSGNSVAPETTGNNGAFSFTDLKDGTYQLVETYDAAAHGYMDGNVFPGLLNGVQDTTAQRDIAGRRIFDIVLSGGSIVGTQYRFGECPCPPVSAMISGYVYLDSNMDCIREANEPGLSGATMVLSYLNGSPVTNLNGVVVAPVVTDTNGFYVFSDLPAGTFEVTELPPQPIYQGQQTILECNTPGTVNGVTVGVAPIGSDVITDITLGANDKTINNDFGKVLPNVAAITLSGNVYFDANRDNLLDAGDSPIGGAQVSLFRLGVLTGLDEVAQTTTNEKGQYLFEIYTPGIYFVRLSAVAGLIKESAQVGTVNGRSNGTEAAIDDLADIDLVDGDSGVDYNFALIKNTPPPSKQQLLANVPGGGATGVAGLQAFATSPSFANIDRAAMTPNIVAVGAGAGGGPEVRVYNFTTGKEILDFFAYSPTFTGGVRVAVAYINGTPDIITAPGAGGSPDIKIFNGLTGALIRSFWAFTPTFTGGVFVAAGDVNGDGTPDIIVGAGAGGGPQVKVFDGSTGNVLANFYAFNSAFHGGISVAAGDFNNDGKADIVVGAGPGGGPQVKIFNAATLGVAGAPLLANFYAFAPTYRGGVNVAANAFGEGSVTGGGETDLVVGTASGVGEVRVFNGSTFALVSDFTAYSSSLTNGGVHVSVFDLDGDGKADVVAGSGGGAGAFVGVVNVATDQDLDFWQAFNPAFLGGVWVASA